MTKNYPVHFHVVTLFPEAFSSYLGSSILGRAIRAKKLKVSFYNPRDFTSDTHRRVDRRPYGGGPGMVLEAPSVLKAAAHATKKAKKVISLFLSPAGKQFTSVDAKKLALVKDILIISGHYEGVDARVRKILKAREVSVGPYILTGGELPAMLIIDAVSRHISGVLGKIESLEESRIASPDVYTRPEVLKWRGKTYRVPKVLLSGHHLRINDWKKSRQVKATP